MQLLHRQANRAPAIILALMGGLVTARAESLAARPGQHNDPDLAVPAGAVERLDQFEAGLARNAL